MAGSRRRSHWTLESQMCRQELTFNALMCINMVTNWVKIIWINNCTVAHVAQKFEDKWLLCYPWPDKCIHDPGPEFTGLAFTNMLWQNGIQDVPTTTKNPQANAICERMHQTVGNLLRAMTYAHILQKDWSRLLMLSTLVWPTKPMLLAQRFITH